MPDFTFTILQDMVAVGRLTGDNIRLDGRPLGVEPEPGQYRPDGWSYATTEYGARSHRLIDEAIAQMEQGDEFDREVAGAAKRYVVCHPSFTDLRPDDPVEAEIAHDAYGSVALKAWMGQPADGSPRFSTFRLDGQKFGDKLDALGYPPSGPDRPHWYIPEAHAVYVTTNRLLVDTMPERYVTSLQNTAEWMRNYGRPGNWWGPR